MYPNVHCSTIYNSQDMDSTWMSFDRWTDKEVVVHFYKGIIHTHKNVSSSEVDETRACYIEWSKSEIEKLVLYINSYLWNLEKWYWWTYL